LSGAYYEALAYAMRYVFALLGVVIAWRAARGLGQDFSQRRRVMSALPDAGYVGTLYIMKGRSKRMNPGDSLYLPMEGVLGSGAGCDVRVHHSTVGGRHALFAFQADGLHLRPYRDERMQVDGQPVPQGCEAILMHGAILTLGAVMLQLRLFAGVQSPAAVEPETKPEPRTAKKLKLPKHTESEESMPEATPNEQALSGDHPPARGRRKG